MHEWAVRQGMTDGRAAVLITDEAAPVTPDRIFEAVQVVIESVAPEQLIVYFAGHGVVIRRSEQWLLTNAPDNPNHAVDLSQSSENASYGQVPHVVLISDACRTAPEGIQAQSVQGGTIFANTPNADQRFVDIFYACGLGRPAAELRTQQESVASYRAVYTEVLREALLGNFRQSLSQRQDDAWYADMRPLRDLLAVEVPRRIRARQLRFHQAPQARIASDPGMWLSRLEVLPREIRLRDDEPPRLSVETTLDQAQEQVVNIALAGDQENLTTALDTLLQDPVPGGADFARTVATVSRTFGPTRFETRCGFKVEGAAIADFFPPYPGAERLDSGASLRLQPFNGAGSVVMAFDNGLATILPAIQDFIAALVFEDDELISVSYEPAKNSWRAQEYEAKEEHLRALRAVAASSSLHGRFSLDVEDPDMVARSMQVSKGIDPTLAIYAAYAFYDLHNIRRIAQMSGYLRDDIGTTFFDLELLSRRLVDHGVQPTDLVLPCVPLLTQGWSIARAHRTILPTTLRDVERYARDSLWSVYDAQAFDLFRQGLSHGDIR